jgi:ankyrin repeat protein
VELAIRNLNCDIANIHVYVEALTLASANGNLKIVEAVLRKVKILLIGWVPYDCDYWVDAALLETATHGHQTVVRLLVEEDASIDEYDPEGTPLILAAARGHPDEVEYLVNNGACFHRANRIGVNHSP